MSAVPVQPPAVGDAVREIEDFGALLQKQLGRDRELRELFWSAEAKHELARCIAENVPCRPFYVKLLLSLIEAAVHWAGGILARNLKEKLFEQAAQVLDAQSPIAGMQRNIVASLRKALADTIVRQRVVTAIRAGKRIDPRTLTADELFNVLSSELTIQLYQLSILEGIRLRLEQLDQPSLLLRARRRPSDQQETSSLANFSFNMNLTGFYGREDEIAFLTDFLADDEQIRWQLVCGPSGSGKRRLAMEFCRDCIDRGWIAGFTSGNLGIQWHTWQPLADTLIVVDQLTAASAKKLKTVLVELHGARGRLKHKVRVLLLAPSPDGLWWSIFFPPTTWEFGLLDDMRWMPPYFLPALSPEDLTTIVKESYRAHLGEDGWLDRNWHSRDRFLQRTGSLQSPLMAMFAGAFLARVSNSKSRQSQAFDRAGFEDLFKAVIDPERERWLSAGASDAFLDELARVTIVGGLSRAQWVSPAVKFDDFAAILGSPKMGSIAALQPELLGEYFVLSQLQQRTVEQVTEFVRQCWAIDSVATRAFFDRALSEFPRHPAVPIIAAVAKPPDGVDKLEWFKFRLDVLKRWPDQSRYFGLRRQIWSAVDNGEINLDPKLVTRLMARAPDYLSARAVFERTAGAPENRETIHFNVLINKATRLVAAEIRKDMISANVAANEYTFHALIPKTAPSHILELLKEMQDAGLKPTARTYELTLEHADACGVESTVEKLLSGGFVFTPEMASVVARRLPAEKAFVVLKRIEDGGRRVRQADFVGLLARHEPSFEFGVAIVGHLTATGRKPNPALCAKLLETTPEAELLDAVAFLERRGLSKDTVIFTVLIDRAGSLPDGLRWYDAMRHAGIAPDERTFSILLAKCSDYTEAEKLMAEMRAQGVVANEFHYAALLRRAPPGEIAGILKRMEECGVRQDVRIYNEVFGKRGRDALSFDAKLRLYLSRPKELIPNAFTFGNLIASCPDLRSAHKLLDDMGELGVARTNFINICLVRLAPNYKDARREAELASAPEGHWTAEVLEALLQQATRFRERFDVGRDVLETMLRFGFSPDVRSLEYLMQNATAEESEWLLSKLPEFGIEPSQILLTLALSAARRNAARDFGAVLRKLTGFGLREDKYTLAIRVQAAEEYAAAVKLFNDTSPSIQPDARVFEALMHKAPDLAERRRWLKAAEHAACPPSAEMYVALLLKSSSGQATELWREMLDIGLRPTARAYSAYMRVLDYDTAYRLYEEMIGADVRPNEEVYRQLVRKAPAEARTELIEDMAAHELKPGIRIYEALVESAPSYAAAQTDFVSMLEAGVQPRPQTIGMVTSLIAKSADMRAFMNTLEDRQVALTPSTIRMLVRAARTYCSPTQAARIERRLWRLKSSERTAA